MSNPNPNEQGTNQNEAGAVMTPERALRFFVHGNRWLGGRVAQGGPCGCGSCSYCAWLCLGDLITPGTARAHGQQGTSQGEAQGSTRQTEYGGFADDADMWQEQQSDNTAEDRPYRWTVEPHPYDRSFDTFVTDSDDAARDALLALWDSAEGECSIKAIFDESVPSPPSPAPSASVVAADEYEKDAEDDRRPHKYELLLPTLRAKARECGYALGVHGSMERDCDLIAAPWTDEATDAQTLIDALKEAVGGKTYSVITVEKTGRLAPQPERKPLGRLGWSIILPGGLYLDVSVLPKLTDDYVAWCRYTYNDSGGIQTIKTCNSDSKGAFRVYAAPPNYDKVVKQRDGLVEFVTAIANDCDRFHAAMARAALTAVHRHLPSEDSQTTHGTKSPTLTPDSEAAR